MACKHSFNISSGCFSPRAFLKSFFSSLKVFFFRNVTVFPGLAKWNLLENSEQVFL